MDKLPVECISCILVFTSPKDVCKLAGVSTAFRSAADCDFLWRTFLPPDYREIIAQSPSSSVLNSLSEKALYFHLSDRPLLIGTGNSSIALQKESGRKCYMIGSRDMGPMMIQPDWTWKFVSQSRFSRAAEVNFATLLPISGEIKAKNLSPKTYYRAYFVFKFNHVIEECLDTFCSSRPIVSYSYIKGKEGKIKRLLDSFEGFNMKREDGWMEFGMGQFFTQEDDATIVFDIYPTCSRTRLILEGVECRPFAHIQYSYTPGLV